MYWFYTWFSVKDSKFLFTNAIFYGGFFPLIEELKKEGRILIFAKRISKTEYEELSKFVLTP